MLAPPWISVPPPGYGGIEAVVALLCDGLVARGHDVTLFCAPGSDSTAAVRPLLSRSYPDEIGAAIYESDHVARAFAAIDEAAADGRPFDVVHDHSGFVALALADRLATPMVHTIHGPFTEETSAFYAQHGSKAQLVAISRSQRAFGPPGLRARVVPNPIRVDDWPAPSGRREHLLWVGRMTEEKGPHRAIDAARLAGRRIVLAGPIQPGQEEFFGAEVAPRLDGERALYVGETRGDAKIDLFAGAAALLMPIRWPEPFGMVMTEALACGTPVIAYPEGAAPEIVVDGESGFLVEDEAQMALAIGRLDEIEPESCRALAAERFDVGAVAAAYEAVYRETALHVSAAALFTRRA